MSEGSGERKLHLGAGFLDLQEQLSAYVKAHPDCLDEIKSLAQAQPTTIEEAYDLLGQMQEMLSGLEI